MEHFRCRFRAEQHVKMSPVLEYCELDIFTHRGTSGVLDTLCPRNFGFIDITGRHRKNRHTHRGKSSLIIKPGSGEMALKVKATVILYTRPIAIFLKKDASKNKWISVPFFCVR